MTDIRLLYGPMLIGVFMNMILYGILIMQVYTYYQTFKQDSRFIKCLVLYLFILESCNTVFDIGAMFEPLIWRYSTPAAVTYFPIMFSSEALCIVLISTPIQLFISWRIRKLDHSTWIPITICALAFISFCGGIWTTVILIKIRKFIYKPKLYPPALVWFIPACLADVLITVTLVRSLLRRKTGFAATDTVINRIIRLTIQTGMITAFAAIMDVVCFLTFPYLTINFFFDLTLAKLYSNSLMSTLNSRAGLNSLLGGTGCNVLFGSEASGRSLNGNRHDIPNYPSPANHVYQLDSNPKPPHTHSNLNGKVDVEYGISVTKVVERLHDAEPTTQ